MEYLKIFKTRKHEDEIIRSTIILPKEDVESVHFINGKICIQTVKANVVHTEIPENEEKYLERKRYFERIFGVEEENSSEEYMKKRQKEEENKKIDEINADIDRKLREEIRKIYGD